MSRIDLDRAIGRLPHGVPCGVPAARRGRVWPSGGRRDPGDLGGDVEIAGAQGAAADSAYLTQPQSRAVTDRCGYELRRLQRSDRRVRRRLARSRAAAGARAARRGLRRLSRAGGRSQEHSGGGLHARSRRAARPPVDGDPGARRRGAAPSARGRLLAFPRTRAAMGWLAAAAALVLATTTRHLPAAAAGDAACRRRGAVAATRPMPATSWPRCRPSCRRPKSTTTRRFRGSSRSRAARAARSIRRSRRCCRRTCR